ACSEWATPVDLDPVLGESHFRSGAEQSHLFAFSGRCLVWTADRPQPRARSPIRSLVRSEGSGETTGSNGNARRRGGRLATPRAHSADQPDAARRRTHAVGRGGCCSKSSHRDVPAKPTTIGLDRW